MLYATFLPFIRGYMCSLSVAHSNGHRMYLASSKFDVCSGDGIQSKMLQKME